MKFLFPTLTVLVLSIMFFSCKEAEDPYLTEVLSIDHTVTGDRPAAQAAHLVAFKAHNEKNYLMSEKLWIEAAKADPTWWKPYFNLACTATLQGKIDKALKYYEIFLKHASIELAMGIKQDSDLITLRDDDRFDELYVTLYKNRYGKHWAYLLIDTPHCLNSDDVPPRSYNEDHQYYYELTILPNGILKVTGFYEPDLLGYRAKNMSGIWYVDGGELILQFKQECDPSEYSEKMDTETIKDCRSSLNRSIEKNYQSLREFKNEFFSRCK